MRAALGLFDLEGEGWIAGDRLQALLFDASFRYDFCLCSVIGFEWLPTLSALGTFCTNDQMSCT